ncbi:MAG: apolipoprotein N-acyltransferase [Bacteroidales bacterium]|nr:apolipoprotein N-acyltransferase [Bacteroidales bacterium]
MRNKIWLVSVVGGLLCSLGWYEKATGLIMLTAFVPFLYIFQYSYNEKAGSSLVFLRVLPGFIIFNLLTISWLRNASTAGAIYAVLAGAFLMSMVFWLSSVIYRRGTSFLGYASIITFWLMMEHLNNSVSILTPWLNLGNALGRDIFFIQWYDISGVAGGSLWILLVNIALFFLIFRKEKVKRTYRVSLAASLLIIILPVTFSLVKYFQRPEDLKSAEFVIVQPNIDPYNEKFSSLSFEEQLSGMLEMAKSKAGKNTDWIILPETAIDDPFYEENVRNTRYYNMIDSLLQEFPSASLITGATTMRSYHSSATKRPVDSKRIDSSNVFYSLHNAAMHIMPGGGVEFYHKSKLVPGIEKKIRRLPGFLSDRLIPDLGGTMAGYSGQEERTVFMHPGDSSFVAPVICYESVYGDFVARYGRKEADYIVIITNDGWWDNTQGYRQHLMFARIRAIENRMPVIRAANTGISCFIDGRGNILKSAGWWEKAVMKQETGSRYDMSFYTKNGDYIYRFITIFGVFVLVITFVAAPIRKLRDPQNFE